MEKILVSACLLGVECRYCGDGCYNEAVASLAARHILIPACPEQLGGLPTPREPAEIKNGRVFTKDGREVTSAFEKGARAALRIVKILGCKYAILKSRSPSCGSGTIYDGSFSGVVTAGDGITASLLEKNGVTLFSEENLPDL